MKRKRVKLIERKLGRERAYGTQEPGLITIDPRLKRKRRLNVVIHEALHEAYPDLTESKVLRGAGKIADVVWRDNWRRVEQ